MALTAWLHDARDDLWFGWRRMIREPDATAAIVLVLACGIGLSVAIFSVADTVLRRPLPLLDEQRVVVLWGEAQREHADVAAHATALRALSK